MTLQSSGQISAIDIIVEAKKTLAEGFDINASTYRTLAVKSTSNSEIKYSDFYGKTKTYITAGSQSFTSNTVWTVPAGASKLQVLVIGGGASSGYPWCNYNNSRTPMTGGSGGYSVGEYYITAGSQYNIVVGSAGQNTSYNYGRGYPGGSSYFYGTGISIACSGGQEGYFVYGPNYGVAGANGTGTGGNLLNTSARNIETGVSPLVLPWLSSYIGYGHGADAFTYDQTGGLVVLTWLN